MKTKYVLVFSKDTYDRAMLLIHPLFLNCTILKILKSLESRLKSDSVCKLCTFELVQKMAKKITNLGDDIVVWLNLNQESTVFKTDSYTLCDWIIGFLGQLVDKNTYKHATVSGRCSYTRFNMMNQ